MDAETRADLRFKVRRRVSDYIEKSNLPLERTGPGEAEVVCPNCGQTAIVTKLPFEDHYEFWKCPACGEEGDAIKYAMQSNMPCITFEPIMRTMHFWMYAESLG